MREKVVSDLYFIRLSGVFDGLRARRLEALLAHAEPGAALQLDLTYVDEFHDFGMAVLARAVTRCKARVTVLGLRRYQLRALREHGVDTACLERAAA